MNINYIKFKNFNSYGDDITEITFDGVSRLNLLMGLNGTGKSTISDAFCYALYGKVNNKSKSDLPNRTNLNLYVEISFNVNSKTVIIKRGIKPNIFEVYINGESVDFSSIKNTQNFLDDEILEIPYHIFNNMMVLSINDFKSFLTLSPSDKRKIIDKIFGFDVLNFMLNDIKEEKLLIKTKLSECQFKINNYNNSINNIKSKIQDSLKNNDERITELLNKNEEIKSLLENKQTQISEANTILETYSPQNLDISKKIIEVETKLKSLAKHIKLHEKGICPTCKSLLDNSTIIDVQKEFESLKLSYLDLKVQKENIDKVIKDTQSVKDVVLREINSYKSDIRVNQSVLKNLENTTDAKNLEGLLVDNTNLLKLENNNLQILEVDLKFISEMERILSGKGVKQISLASVIPNLNMSLSELCKDANLPYIISFDSKFNASLIGVNNTNISIKTLSTGQRKLTDFLCLIALLKVLKLRFPSTNLLFLDEVFSSLDSEKVYDITIMLRRIVEDMGMNIFVVNHAPLPSEYFDTVYETSIVDKFSKLTISEN